MKTAEQRAEVARKAKISSDVVAAELATRDERIQARHDRKAARVAHAREAAAAREARRADNETDPVPDTDPTDPDTDPTDPDTDPTDPDGDSAED